MTVRVWLAPLRWRRSGQGREERMIRVKGIVRILVAAALSIVATLVAASTAKAFPSDT